jgi:transcriptional regulator with GAF, ATPase, and Fis domain
VGGRPLEANATAPLTPGELVEIGRAMLVVQPGAEIQAPAAEGPGEAQRAGAADAVPPIPAGIIVADPAMERIYRLLELVARGTISVLVLGETGAGKEIAADAIHRFSPRRDRPLVALNCAALPEALLESELFGYERGAFTGAVAAKPGLLEAASGGTVFLDEVGELPPTTQAKLLRVVESRQVTRIGALSARPIDIRLVSATNRDLEEHVRQGRFRQDLLFRLGGVRVLLPPLRERAREIEPLAMLFARRACAELGKREPNLSAEARAWLLSYPWPGNVRELRHVMERAVLLCAGGTLQIEHLQGAPLTAGSAPPAARAPGPEGPASAAPRSASTAGAGLRSEVELFERQRILDALERCGGNQTQAAKLLGIARRTLIDRLDAYDLPRPRKGRGSADE